MLAAIALGSNLPSRFGGPTDNLKEALHRLGDLGRAAAVSTFRETEPVGLLEQPRFVNAAALLETELGPLDLLRGILAIEREMGRVRFQDTAPKGPRIVDLDLLLYQNEQGHSLILSDPDLILPHPAMHHRLFVLEPLAEIAAGWRHPVLQRSIGELVQTVMR